MTIRKVDLNMKEQEKYEIIKKLVETNGNKKKSSFKNWMYTKAY